MAENVIEDFRKILEQFGRKSGISYEEMEKRFKEFIDHTPTDISHEELNKRVQEYLATLPQTSKKVKPALKITVSLDSTEAKNFLNLKQKMMATSNAEVIHKLLTQTLSKKPLQLEEQIINIEDRLIKIASDEFISKKKFEQILISDTKELLRISELRSLPIFEYTSSIYPTKKYYILDGLNNIIYVLSV